jgi:hypothetical protein
MTKDTLIIIDKINKKIRVGNPQVLKNKYGVEPAFIFVILGDFIIEKQSQELPLGCRNGISSDQFIVGGRTVNYTIDCKRKKIVSASFEGDIKTGNIDMEFSDFIILEDMLLPGSVNISNDLSMFKAKVEIEKATINYEGIIGSIKPGSNYIVLRLK